MTNTFSKLLLAGSMAMIAGFSYSQTLLHCGADEERKKLIETHPEILAREAAFEAFAAKHPNIDMKLEDDKIIIPVVFHIIHDYGPENISDAQVLDAMANINADYSKTNADFGATIPEFTGIAADCNIEFRLAQRELSGGCTNGIDRIPSLRTYAGGDPAKLGGWQSGHYLNIWVTKTLSGGAAAYAYYPTSITGLMYTVDGIICRYDYVGTIGASGSYGAHVLSHEIGHYLNLQHVWGNSNSPGVACGDDQVSDTPMTEGWTTCNIYGNTCGGAIDNVQNHMEYSYCSTMFTEGQKARIYAALESTDAMRNNLYTDENLGLTGTSDGYIATGCVPKADFYSNYRLTCAGNSVNYYDVSFNATVVSRTWDFEGGEPAISTETNPVVTYSEPGWHKTTLTVTNENGTTTKSVDQYIFISTADPVLNETYFADFNDEAEVNANWILYNKYPDDREWKWRSTNGYWNTGCLWLNSRNGPDLETDQVISPSFDLSLGNTDLLFFKYSTTSDGLTSSDYTMSLKLYYSTNCGQSWIYFNKITGDALISSYGGASDFYPKYPDQWASASFNLPEACKTNNVKFKLEFNYNNYVNNIFIDDFNFTSGFLSTTSQDDLFEMNISPNPVVPGRIANIGYSLKQASAVELIITDLAGKTVFQHSLGEQSPGSHEYHFDTQSSNIAPGCYIVRIGNDTYMVNSKMIVL